MITNFNVPADSLILNLKPRDLSEQELQTVIYARWYVGYDARFGVFILISAAEIGYLADTLPVMEELGYNNVKEIKEVPASSKKWDDEKFFI